MIKLMLLAALVFPGLTFAQAQDTQSARKPVALEKPQPADQGRVKKDPALLQEKVAVIAASQVQPEERCIEVEESQCEESAESSEDLSFTVPASTAYSQVMTSRIDRPNRARIETAEKVTRYHWVDENKEVCSDVSATAVYLPVVLNYLETDTRGQMIYPASKINLAAGTRITSITFHTEGNLSAYTGTTNSKVTLSLGETTTGIYSSSTFLPVSGVCVLATILTDTETVTFVLNSPYVYNGGNLIVDVHGDGSGDSWVSGSQCQWKGESQEGYDRGLYYRSGNSSSPTKAQFLPWMTIGYQVEKAYEADAPVSGNKDFFHAIEYTWPINVAEAERPAENKARLDEVATDPDQMIAMLQKVYTDPSIPGNWKRGYTTDGRTEPYDDVAYTGVGGVRHSGSDYTTGFYYNDNYGWNVPGDIVAKITTIQNSSSSTGVSTVYYAHMDSTQYKPDQDGLTLLLIEMRDDYSSVGMSEAVSAVTSLDSYTQYDVLKARVGYGFKSIRVVTESKRTGEGFDAGTLFKIDCDKMNKFFMVAKGQVRYPFNSNRIFAQDDSHPEHDQTYCRLPLYARCSDLYYQGSTTSHSGWKDYNSGTIFRHMFEQFSPYDLNDESNVTDIYQRLVNMDAYSVAHDCINVPTATPAATPAGGHHFRMYGDTVDISKCQDVRDLMFFVPDYRMMHFTKHTETNERSVYVAYNNDGTNMTTSAYIPVYGYYYDVKGSYDQMIYPKDMLSSLGGKKIKSITFYPSDPISFGNPSAGAITAEIGTVEEEHFEENVSDFLIPSPKVSKTFTPTYGATEMTITFDEPFTYKAGTNLLVDLTVTTEGSYDQTYWIGMSTDNNQSINCYSNNGIYPNKFLPTMKITYEETTTEGGNRDSGNGTGYTAQTVKFLNYNPAHRPSMALYVIRQDEVTCLEEDKHNDYYKLTLTWDSNMDEFLPASQQKYNLLQLVTDEFGVDKYIPVYYTNEYGQHLDGPNGAVLPNQNDTASWVPIQLTNIPPSADKKTYTDVFVRRTPGSQQVTYAIQGCDMDEFLSLQISNQQSYIIPGKDPAEMALLDEVTYYSRYNPQTQRNCYSNRLVVKSNPESILDSYFTANESNPTIIKLLRTTGADDTNPVTVATIKVTSMPTDASNGQLLLQVYQQAAKTDYPTGENDNPVVYAGYHPNVGGEGDCSWYRSFYVRDGYVNLGALEIFDNFTVDVSENKHPAQYLYQVKFETAEEFKSLDGWTNVAYSNLYRIPVYKTDTKISALKLDQVLDDNECNTDYSPENTTFQEQVQLSSKTEILRYDAYRWEGTNPTNFYILKKVRTNDDEDRVAPTGMASNQGDGYSVSMNKQGTEDYYTTEVNVSQSDPRDWAKFVDRVPGKSESAKVFTYAPVVELFTKGVDAAGTARRADYNTYGGPQQTTAVGKLELIPYVPTKNEINPENGDPSLAQMSEYTWYGEENKCYSYYNLMFNFKALELPSDEYELFKVRAWRRMVDVDEDDNVVSVDNSILGEELETRRKVRIGQIDKDGWYMYEDMNFGDQLVLDGTKTMSWRTLHPGLAENDGELLGHRSTSILKPLNPGSTGPAESLFEPEEATNPTTGQFLDELVRNEMRSTFGAQRMKIEGDDSGTLDKDLNAEFKVRAYFTKKSNPLVNSQGSNSSQAPRRDGETALSGSDFDYYIAEGTALYKMKKGSTIITGIDTVKMDVNCEVVGVTYVNPVGQMSSTPWQGVNIVVTRYSDGSTTTQKVIR